MLTGHLRLVLWALVLASCLAACEGEAELRPGYDFGGNERKCLGAFTPGNEACWLENDGGVEQGAFESATGAAQENNSRLAGDNRCAEGIVLPPGVTGTLAVKFTTVSTSGKYAPRNCGAIWIEDAFGAYVRTLNVWAGERAASVSSWNGSKCGTDADLMNPDVVTSATINKHEAHSATWDTKDYKGRVVADGEYTLWLQVTENEIFPEGPFIQIPFIKGPAPLNIKQGPNDLATLPLDKRDLPLMIRGFSGIEVTYAPGTGAPQAPTP